MKHTFCILFLMAIGLLLAETWIYEKTVVELPMGEEEGQLSVRIVPRDYDCLDEGPTSFTVDEDENIYLLTRRKNIIKKFDKNGNFVCASKYEGCAGDVIRFLGYHDGMVYTMSGDMSVVCVRRYSMNLELVDYHTVIQGGGFYYGFSFIESYQGKFGLLIYDGPKAIQAGELVLINSQYHLESMELFDFTYKPVDLKKVWRSEIGYRFMNYDRDNYLYFENMVAPLTATELGIVTENGDFISTNVVFDSNLVHDVHFYDRVYPFISKSGVAYNLVVSKDKIEYVRWYKTGVEQ